jgi:glyoxylase-like metal-dependent hydrolase (beta-lactamase superfamily II)
MPTMSLMSPQLPLALPPSTAPDSARRRWLGSAWAWAWMGAGPAVAVVGLAGCGAAALRQPAASHAAATFEPVAPGLWLARGQGGEVDPANRGRVGNTALVAGPRGALVVGGGVSRRQGVELLAAARQIASVPVRALLITPVRQEFVLGAPAFQEAGVPVVMHPAAARLMRARCDNCLKNLQRELGAEEMAGSRVVTPDRLLEAGDPWLAEVTGRPLRLLTFGVQAHSSGPGDVALLDEASGSLLAGGLVSADSVPDVQDADFAGWRQALAALGGLPLQRILPGHGPVCPPQQIQRIAGYLDALEARTAQLLAAGVPLSEVAEATELPAFARWEGYDSVHRRNAAIVYLRQERELLRQPAPEGR